MRDARAHALSARVRPAWRSGGYPYTRCRRLRICSLPDQLLQTLELRLQLIAGFRHLVGVVDDARRQEHDQLRASLGRRLVAECEAQDRNSMEEGETGGSLRV